MSRIDDTMPRIHRRVLIEETQRIYLPAAGHDWLLHRSVRLF